ncbi:TPA: hypothetical protein PPS74_005103, partial [Salmonella enterica subsp. enterica serovar Concord]|nr:hypothetical protein [Salmonella enterica subsp. enterica serovar Concord]
NMEKAAEKVATFNSESPGFVGWEIKIANNKVRVIKDEKELKRLIKLYYKYPFDPRQTGIVLTNGFTNRFADEIRNSMSSYALHKAYLELSSNPNKDQVIDEIVSEVEKMVDKFKTELNSFCFN